MGHSPPTSVNTGDLCGGTRQDKQTKRWPRAEAEQRGLPQPPLPPEARSQPQMSVKGIGPAWGHLIDEEGG